MSITHESRDQSREWADAPPNLRDREPQPRERRGPSHHALAHLPRKSKCLHPDSSLVSTTVRQLFVFRVFSLTHDP